MRRGSARRVSRVPGDDFSPVDPNVIEILSLSLTTYIYYSKKLSNPLWLD
jgi:hypothetical protein